MTGHELNQEFAAPTDGERMSNDEAQAVIDLWAKRRKEAENDAGLPTTQELAEALNAPPEEVAQLLGEVRRANQPPVEETILSTPRRERRRRRFLWFVVAATVVGAVAVQTSRQSAVAPLKIADASMAPIPSAMEAPTTVSADARYIESSTQLPTGLKVTFDGYTLHADRLIDPLQSSDVQLEDALNTSILQAVNRMSQIPLANDAPAISVAALNASLMETGKSLPGYFVWKTLTLELGGSKRSFEIPIAISDGASLLQAVQLEQQRRIRQAASQGVDLVRLPAK